MKISKTTAQIILVWLLSLPYIFSALYGLLYLTVLNKPGYQSGEQFTPILILMGVLAIAVSISASRALLHKNRNVYILIILWILFGLPDYSSFFSNVLVSHRNVSIATIIQMLFYLVADVLLLILLILDRHSFFKKKSAPIQ